MIPVSVERKPVNEKRLSKIGELSIPGFEDKTLEFFLGYCEIHSQTPRAVFSINYIEILYGLVGMSLNEVYRRHPIPKVDNIHEKEMKWILGRIFKRNPDILYV